MNPPTELNRDELLAGAFSVVSGGLMSALLLFVMLQLPEFQISHRYLQSQAVVAFALIGTLPAFVRAASGRGRLFGVHLAVFLVSSVVLVAAFRSSVMALLPYGAVALVTAGGAAVAPDGVVVRAAGLLSASLYAFGLVFVVYSVLATSQATLLAPFLLFSALFVGVVVVFGQESGAASAG